MFSQWIKLGTLCLLWLCVCTQPSAAQSSPTVSTTSTVTSPSAPASAPAPADNAIDPVRLREALGKSLRLIEHSSAEYLKQRECFSCHHQSLPIVTLLDARERGLPVDDQNLQRQVTRTLAHLQRGQADYAQGKGQGGGVDTAGYALLGLARAAVPASPTTDAVVEYLLQVHQGKRRWTCSSNRPPTEASDVTTSALAIEGLLNFAGKPQLARVQSRLDECVQWLAQHKDKDTEERVFHLRALHVLKRATDAQSLALAFDGPQLQQQIEALQNQLLASQKPDGGWAQTAADSASDAYATGTALMALAESGYSHNEPAYLRGLEFLLTNQHPDGSWQVVTRSKPIQKYFESGFPHGVDQFISISATCWAALALQQTLPIDQVSVAALPELPWLASVKERDQVQPSTHTAVNATRPSEPTAEQIEFFEREIRPVLIESCASCHGPDEQSGGLRIDSLASLMSGGDSGPALIPGAPERSLLMRAVRRLDELKMPPEAPLAQNKITSLQQWVEMGAPWPKDATSETFDKRRRAAQEHWAFQLPTHAPLPALKQPDVVRNYIDHFVQATLEQAQLQPHRPAARRELLRRLSYDLIGLPPTLQEFEQFEQDTRPDAVERVIDRLLASPKFGQHWARHWLDVARYSDTKGYVYAREERFFVHAAAYRDWVVRALADDMPYDQFVRLQLAADQVAANDPQAQVAMGYLTLGRRFLGVTHDIIDDRIDVVTRGLLGLTVSCARCHDHKFDPIPTAEYYSLYGVFLNSIERRTATRPVGHDSATAEDPQLRKLQDKYLEQLTAETNSANERVKQRLKDYLLAQLELEKYPAEGFDVIIAPDDLVPAQLRRVQAWMIEAGYRDEPIFAAWRLYQALPAESFAQAAQAISQTLPEQPATQHNHLVVKAFQQPPASMREVAERYAQLLSQVDTYQCIDDAERVALAELKDLLEHANSPFRVPAEDIVSTEQFFPSRVTETLWKLQGEIDRFLINTPGAPTYATQLVDRAFIRQPHVFRRGNPLQIAQRVPRQFLSALCAPIGSEVSLETSTANLVSRAPAPTANQRPIERMPLRPFTLGSGRRELAEAIVDTRNPLTARVWTNRLWQHLFGQGLVSTPSDFGLRAQPPSHPELLDRLAIDLSTHDFSTKWIVRQLVSSYTYQQSSRWANAIEETRFQAASQLDPDNRWLWRANDKRLSFEQLRDTWLAVSGQLDYSFGGRAQPLFGEGINHRRTLYGLVDRQFLAGVLRIFDFANPDLHTPQRSQTTVPQQALFGLNHEFTAALARELASPMEGGSASAADRQAGVTALFRQILGRDPREPELASCLTFLDQPPDLIPTQPAETHDWQYGFGQLNEAKGTLDGFNALPYFSGTAWQGGPKWPDSKLGWVQLTATGGHAGNDLEHAAVRRWLAPVSGVISINSQVVHNTPAGDGVRAAIVHRRAVRPSASVEGTAQTSADHSTILANQVVHNQEIALNIQQLTVEAGDTLDFVVDFHGNLNNDQFTWAPKIIMSERQWQAERDFAGPTTSYLTPWQQLAQVLLLSNELAFVD